jgi:hypothetical protein
VLERDEREVTRIAVDPIGVTEGTIREDLQLPKVH